LEVAITASDNDVNDDGIDYDDNAKFRLCLSGWYFNEKDLCAALNGSIHDKKFGIGRALYRMADHNQLV